MSTEEGLYTGSGTVLVVDDEWLIRNMCNDILTDFGFTVIEAKDGVEALEVFQLHGPEICLLLCDVMMPRLNGWETLTALRKIAPTIPVILMSGFAESQVMAGEHSEVPQVFIRKPYTLQTLISAIRQALSS